METALSLLLGIGLSAACGFRVFVPLLVVNVGALSGHVALAKGFAWLGSYPALIVLCVATALEIGAYYVPWLDNFLDTLAAPAAVVAGTVLTASVLSDMSPMMRWTLAAIAGGTAAGVVQGGTMLVRGLSTFGTGGLMNPVVSTLELGGALGTSLFMLIAPVLGIVLLCGVVGVAGWKLALRRQRLS